MSEIADRHRRLAAAFTERVEAIPEQRWENPSPCPGWTARDVVGHVIEAGQSYFTLIGQEPPSGPPVDRDPVAAWVAVRDGVQAALEDPDTATTEYDGVFGRMTFENGINQLFCFDLLVHAWDLARATGLDERLDPHEVYAAFEMVKPMDDMLRGSGAFGPKVRPPREADQQTRFLAFLGRTV
ncbi:TIGR03086 family metal-binding protein [Phytoactinopolyspora mesophila]|uniref:TIGR03086 family protein n=1 Tax=Phytoactinopolyspora mesophila TaxID=2650750 RepID=A0A7K3M315_9ACTN|nr:TIGR03086 family metal-binding protein [Phytoactinopolyspora mesophila]NDL56838.1 TIGR03086 family protein [Phytoactinopolyspora mesophila]